MKSIKNNEYLLFKNKKDWKKHTEKVSEDNMYTIDGNGIIDKDNKPNEYPAFFKLANNGVSYMPIDEEVFAKALNDELKSTKVIVKELKKIRDKYDLDLENYEDEGLPFVDSDRDDWDNRDDDDTEYDDEDTEYNDEDDIIPDDYDYEGIG